MAIKVLCINPGSTSTRWAVFSDDTAEFVDNIVHTKADLENFTGVQDQLEYRFDMIGEALKEQGIDLREVDVVVGRGGALPFKEGGVFNVTAAMLKDCISGKYADHPSNLGCQLAKMFAAVHSVPCYVVDPPLLDEFEPVTRVSGYPGIERRSAFHALNEKAVARKIAARLGKKYDEVDLVTTHLGSGVSVTAHRKGRCIDNTYGSGGDGPFSPERCGRLPGQELLAAIAEEPVNAAHWKKVLAKQGGVYSYFGTNDMLELSARAKDGEGYVGEILAAMVHRIAEEIAAFWAILDAKIDGIGITGAIANNIEIVDQLRREVEFIAPVYVYPGEFEMEALAAGGQRVLTGEEKAKDY